jgi:hypothetical protein
MDEEEIEVEEIRAEEMREEEASRSKPSSCPDPGRQNSGMSDSDVACLKSKHAFLKDFSDYFIRNTPVGDLMKIQSTSIRVKEFEKNKDVDDKLATNKAELATTFSEVPAGKDNRWSSLHEGRFLPGAGCSVARLWLSARDKLGTSGMAAIGSYDLAAVGLAGYVSARGWTELHTISSQKISVRMFNNHCCGNKLKKGSGAEDEEYSLDLEEFKLALRVLRTAVQFVMPWNFSVMAIEGFLFQNSFCGKDLASVEKKGVFLGKFVDYILHQNGDRWRDSEPFYTVGELKTAWTSFFGSQPVAALANKQKKDQQQKKAPQRDSAIDAKRSLGICFAWNAGQCVKAPGTCTTVKGKSLKHICDWNPDRSKPLEICGKDHMRKDFHK